jgi:hypothetical protein
MHVVKDSISFAFEATWAAIKQSLLQLLYHISIRNGKVCSNALALMEVDTSFCHYFSAVLTCQTFCFYWFAIYHGETTKDKNIKN